MSRSFDSPEHGMPTSPRQHYSPPTSPAAHPDSAFNRLRAQRGRSREQGASRPPHSEASPASAPPPPPHRDPEGGIWGRELGYTDSAYSNITPGADNFGEQAAGGLAGVAMSVAEANARESGLEAMRNTPGYDPRQPSYEDSPYQRPMPHQEISQSSLTPLSPAAIAPGSSTPRPRSNLSRSTHSMATDPYADTPYGDYTGGYSRNIDPDLTQFDPNSIEDDGDDGLEYRGSHRNSMLSLGQHSDRGLGAATGGVLGSLGGLVGRKSSAPAQYDPVTNPSLAGTTPYSGIHDYDLGSKEEKSEWLNKQSTGNKKFRWIVGIVIALIIAGAIAGGVAGGLLSRKKSTSTTSGQSASDDTSSHGDLSKDSAEIKALMNNPNLHKVFPGIDYTPMYTQYPDCLSYPASQNNVTRDLAVLSQLTNTIRLYGTDCNQTELLMHSIDQLGMNDTIKVWLGVWQDNNSTTNARQLEQLYGILDKYDTSSFVGIIVGNEVLYRQDMNATELGTVISNVKSNLTARGISLPVASSDLGDDWTADLANEVDYVMANIHPFFAGVTAELAAGWTWTFWQGNDVSFKSDTSRNIISETGWPSQGGTDCGAATSCTTGSTAGIDEMNTFLDTWVCQALDNGTTYFWFEAFDEPWKIVYDTTGKEWEDHWGIMDANRVLKDGVVIPDCGGKTV
ncbi:hypothetical protein B7494_g7907 [Chlorociboria aeruginascens]|nr:hypothetical protein B7494_g7907 [Chlorociboria aeruginascens]